MNKHVKFKNFIWLMNIFFLPLTCMANPGALFNVTSSGSNLTINTVASNHTYPNAGILITTPGYTLTGVGSECSLWNNNYCLFSVSDSTAKTLSYSGSGSPLNVILCLDGKSKQSCQNFNNVTVQSPAKYAYITNYSGQSAISVCALDSNGLFTTCSDAGQDNVLGSSGPQGIVINNAATRAYLTGSTGSPIAYQCSINSLDGTFSSCTSTTITVPNDYVTEYGMITLNPDNSYAFIADAISGGRIFACPITAGVMSDVCVDTGATNIDGNESGITFNNAGTQVYMANYTTSLVTICSVNGTTFSNCIAKTGAGSITFDMPGQVALNKDETIAFIADYGRDAVYGCSTTPNNTSEFDNCFVAGANIPNAWGIAVNKTGTMAYVADYSSTVYQCPILPDNTFATCVLTNTFGSPVSVGLSY